MAKAIQREEGDIKEVEALGWALKVIEDSKSRLAEAGIVSHGWGTLESTNPMIFNFVVIVTWDEKFCQLAVKSCMDEMPQFIMSEANLYHNSWTVSMKTNI